MCIGFNLFKETKFFKVGNNCLTACESVHTLVCACVFVHKTAVVDDTDDGQVVSESKLEVVGVVGRCDLHCAGAKTDFAIVVANNGDFSVREGEFDHLANVFCHLFVLGVDCHCGVAKHCFRTSGCDGDIVVFAHHGIAVIPKV